MSKRPEHARTFKGAARNIPERELFMLPYQSRWIEDHSLLKLMEKSRRIGISYGTSYEIVRDHARKSRRLDTWVSSRDEPTARLFVEDCKKFSRILRTAADDLGFRIMDKEEVYSLGFANGSQLHSVASNADVFAGKGGDVVLDEFALRKDPRAVYGIASPTIDWGGRMRIISTHRGSANFFNKLIEEITHKGNPKGFSHHRVTLQDALDQGFLWKLQTKLPVGDPRLAMTEADYFDYQRSRAPDEETFLQEYMCLPADDNSAFLPYDLIATCEIPAAEGPHVDTEETTDYSGRKGKIRTLWLYSVEELAERKFPLFLGCDVGRDHDLTVLWVAARVAGVLLPVYMVEMAAVEFDRQEAELYRLLALPGMHRACIDNTGLGKQLGERAQKRFGQYRVELVTFSGGIKEQLAYPVRMAFEDRSMRIPSDDKVVADLRAIKKETTAAGNIRFTADRGTNGHSDRFWALALMVHAAGTESGRIVVQSKPRDTVNATARVSKRLGVTVDAF